MSNLREDRSEKKKNRKIEVANSEAYRRMMKIYCGKYSIFSFGVIVALKTGRLFDPFSHGLVLETTSRKRSPRSSQGKEIFL